MGLSYNGKLLLTLTQKIGVRIPMGLRSCMKVLYFENRDSQEETAILGNNSG